MHFTMTPYGRVELAIDDLPTAGLAQRDGFARTLESVEPVSRNAPSEQHEPAEAPEGDEPVPLLPEDADAAPTPPRPTTVPPTREGEGAEGAAKDHAPSAGDPRARPASAVLEPKAAPRAIGPTRPAAESTAPPLLARRNAHAHARALRVVARAAGSPGPVEAAPRPTVAGTRSGGTVAVGPTGSKGAARSALPRAQRGFLSRRGKAIEITEAQRDSVFRSVALTIGEGKSEMSLLLDPPELGKLDVRVALGDGRLRVRLTAERDETGELLDGGAAKLRSLLAGQGFGDLELEVRTGGQGFDGSADSGEPDERRSPGDGAGIESTRTFSVRQVATRIAGGGIDFTA